jgi:ATP-grasp ribosomal peptide maturase
MTVLILTDDDDRTASRVAVELAGRGIPVVQIDPADFPVKVNLAGEINSGTPWSGTVIDSETRHTRVDLADIACVYYRRPTQFQLAQSMSGPERAFAYGEARRGFGGVLQALSDCLWLNDPVAAARAEYKPIQLSAATACGLAIPETIITNDPHRAHAWASRLAKPIIYKPLAGIWHADEGQVRALYTSPVNNPDDLLDPAMSLTAHMFQAQISKDLEARAVVVGEEVFTVAIETTSDQGQIDWRSDYDSHRYEIIDLPVQIRDKLVRLHQRLDLIFGAVDLIRDPSGRWVFLETNQNGEWGWLTEETGIPVATALADVMEKGPQWRN